MVIVVVFCFHFFHKFMIFLILSFWQAYQDRCQTRARTSDTRNIQIAALNSQSTPTQRANPQSPANESLFNIYRLLFVDFF